MLSQPPWGPTWNENYCLGVTCGLERSSRFTFFRLRSMLAIQLARVACWCGVYYDRKREVVTSHMLVNIYVG